MLLAESILNNSLALIIFWVIMLVVTLIIELTTEQLVSIWFSGGSLIALILAICNVPWYIQLLVFSLVSLICVAIVQVILFKKRKKSKNLKTNVDSLIGEKILVIKDVSPEILGEGKYRDVVWSLKSDTEISKDEYAEIVSIEGNKLIVKKIEG